MSRYLLNPLEATQAVAIDLRRQLTALERQRDAALELADKWKAETGHTLKSIAVRFALSECADDFRAIFAPKEGK